MTNSERCISRQHAFRRPPGEARPDWWMLTEVARRMGWSAEFSYRGPADIFREHAALSAFENGGATPRIFNIGQLARLSDDDYDRIEPTRWPVSLEPLEMRSPSARLFGNGQRFPTDTGGRALSQPRTVVRWQVRTKPGRYC